MDFSPVDWAKRLLLFIVEICMCYFIKLKYASIEIWMHTCTIDVEGANVMTWIVNKGTANQIHLFSVPDHASFSK